jgi:uncharacterized membrane protein YhhN
MESGNAGKLRQEKGPQRRTAIWLCLINGAAALAIVGAYMSLPWLYYSAKPLTTLLIVTMVWRMSTSERGYRNGVLIGLLLSTLGDVLLMLPGDYFVFGLASFLLAHLAYLFAFTRRQRLFAVAWPVLVYAASATTVLLMLWPKLPPALTLPVIVYVSVLATMAAQAAVVWRLRRDRSSAFAAVGGLFFVASDSMLAIDRFAAPFAAATLAVLATYWIAQSLIGLSSTSGDP